MRNICKDIREAKGLTQEEFATKIDVSRQTIIRWERNPEDIPLRSLVKVLIADTEEAI